MTSFLIWFTLLGPLLLWCFLTWMGGGVFRVSGFRVFNRLPKCLLQSGLIVKLQNWNFFRLTNICSNYSQIQGPEFTNSKGDSDLFHCRAKNILGLGLKLNQFLDCQKNCTKPHQRGSGPLGGMLPNFFLSLGFS